MAGGKPTHFEGDLRQELLEAAERALSDGGLSALSLRGIAKAVGVSHAAPAHYFPDKRALISALGVYGAEQLESALTAAIDPRSTPVRRIGRLGRAYLQFAAARPALFQVMLQRNATHPVDGALESAEAAALNVLRNEVHDAVQSGWGNGLPPNALTLLLWSTVHGLAALLADREIDTDASDGVIDSLIRLGDHP